MKACCYEAAAIVEDMRAQCGGGFRSAIDLLEMAILPTLLYRKICLEFMIEDAYETSVDRGRYRKLLDKACTELDEKEMKDGMFGMSKLERLVNNDCFLKMICSRSP